jgi:hypothetical protein
LEFLESRLQTAPRKSNKNKSREGAQ